MTLTEQTKNALMTMGLEKVIGIVEVANTKATVTNQEGIILDVVTRFQKYGSMTVAQAGLLKKLVAQIEQYAAKQIGYAAERELAANAPSGRVKIKGEILKAELRETRFGSTWKMLVKAQEGYLIWSTVPSGAPSAAKGEMIEFVATIKPSPEDPKFGFASRPLYVGGVKMELVAA